MKKTNLLYMMLMLLGMTFAFSGCSDDDDEVSNGKLVGTWEATWYQGYEIYSDGDRYEWDEPADEYRDRITFEADGSYSLYLYDSGSWRFEAEGTWKTSGSKLYMHCTSDDDDFELNIITLTESQLIMDEYMKDPESEYYEKVTFKKVN